MTFRCFLWHFHATEMKLTVKLVWHIIGCFPAGIMQLSSTSSIWRWNFSAAWMFSPFDANLMLNWAKEEKRQSHTTQRCEILVSFEMYTFISPSSSSCRHYISSSQLYFMTHYLKYSYYVKTICRSIFSLLKFKFKAEIQRHFNVVSHVAVLFQQV